MRAARRVGVYKGGKFGANGFTYTGAYQWIDDGNDNWRIKFLTSGTFRPKYKVNVDVFLVGGGGGTTNTEAYAAGSGGGYTNTFSNKSAAAGVSYPIVVGAGGYGYANGGASSALGYTVGGGCTHKWNSWDSVGGAGGSGGGGYGANNGYAEPGGNGGSDGGNGQVSNTYRSAGGAGQGYTTREFGQAGGTLYAGGGGGASGWENAARGGYGGAGGGGNGGYGANRNPSCSAAANTGGGAGKIYGCTAASGGSGIVVIRNKR